MDKKIYKKLAWASFILGILNLLLFLSVFFIPNVSKFLGTYNLIISRLIIFVTPSILGVIFGIGVLLESFIEGTSKIVKLAIVGIILNLLFFLTVWLWIRLL